MSDRYTDEEGRLFIENCPLTKACVNDYYGWEIPGWEALGLVRNRRYAMLRSPDALDEAARAGRFDGIQLLDEHVPVDAEHPGKATVAGAVGNGCWFDGEYVRTPLLSIWGAVDIDGVESGERRELSASYAYDPLIKSGKFKGLPYDGIMINIRPNHIALVEKGRAGPDVRVSDALPKGFRMKRRSFDRFVRKARKRFAQDADISAAELLHLLTARAGLQPGDGDDPDACDAVFDALPPGAYAFLKDRLTDDDLNQLAQFWRAGADDDDDDDEDDDAIDDDDDDDDWRRACDKVAPYVGRVRAEDGAPQNAAAVYRRALTLCRVNHKGVTQTRALKRMVEMLPLAQDADPLDGVLPDRRIIRS